MSERQNLQGIDPKNQVFSGLASILYAAESPISGSYIDQSRILAARLDTVIPLRGRRVLDVGCGYGTTTMALSRHAPGELVGVDSSVAHCELFRTIFQSQASIREYLISKNAEEVLSEYFEPTVAHLESMRREYERGVFRRNGGDLLLICKSALDLGEVLALNFEAIAGNNFLHWPVNQLRAKYEKETGMAVMPILVRAFRDALYPLVDLLAHDGVMAFLEPKDFVTDDINEERDRDLESMTMTSHPVFVKTQDVFNKLLLARYGILRPATKTTALFRLSQMESLFEAAGLELREVCFHEGTFACNPVDAFFVRMPMWTGSLNLAFDQKLELMEDVKMEVKKIVTSADMAEPIRNEYFVFIVKKN